jgi:hypothetical protein
VIPVFPRRQHSNPGIATANTTTGPFVYYPIH